MDLTAAQAEKFLAEAEAFRVKTEQTRQEMEGAAAESHLQMRVLEAEARQAEAEAEVSEMGLHQERWNKRIREADWTRDLTLNYVGSIARDSVQASIDKLHLFHKVAPGEPITITFNSPGGSVIDGMALFDYIRFLRGQGHHITIIAMGYAASMAGILLQAADHRVMARGSWMLIHEVAFGAAGKIGEVEDMAEFGKRLKEQAAQIFVERSGGKLTREYLEQKWQRRDWWLDPDEALALGLIDEVR